MSKRLWFLSLGSRCISNRVSSSRSSSRQRMCLYYTPVSVPQRRGDLMVVDKDKEPNLVNIDKLASLKPAFYHENGTITAANASSLNDGAAAMVLMTEQDARYRASRQNSRLRRCRARP
mmetsp:Transcript_9072/g.12063  ORF Transcript_9072/g.12063 Transcript_9072/m.12063 type:complete len:119 (-) Transcript_9072:364-720(-)